MPEILEESQGLESTTVGIFRTAAVVKGGRRFSFSALVVVGDRRGNIGVGYGKAPGVPAAIEKAQKAARKELVHIAVQDGTLPHAVTAKFGASIIKLLPAAPGTGVSAGGTVRAVLELAGVRDCLTKAYGSTNKINLCKAAVQGLRSLRTKSQIAAVRGVTIATTSVDEVLAKGKRYAPQVSSESRAKGPTNTVGQRDQRSGRGGRGRGRGGSDRGRGPAPTAGAQAPSQPAAGAKPAGESSQTPQS